MKIFVSHKKEDETIAIDISKALQALGHSVYLDVIDNEILKGTIHLADYLKVKLTECDSLIAVISNATQLSWWVPWEIGVASEKDYPLGSFLVGATAPPEYLRKWPIMRTIPELKVFGDFVRSVETKEGMIRRAMDKSYNSSKITATQFHTEMKKKLGQ
jgi:hypothetical protein